MVLQLQVWALLLLQEAAPTVGFDVVSMFKQMSWPAKLIVLTLFIMSAWSIGVMIDRVIAFNGKAAYENFSQRPCDLGLQKLRLYGALVFVLPSTTEKSAPGPNGKLRYFRQLAKLLAKLQNEQTTTATVVQSL